MTSSPLSLMEQMEIRDLPEDAFWREYESLLDENNETDARTLLLERCRWDVETFARVFFPHYCEYPFNQFHRDCFADWRQPLKRARHADVAPRGSAKSTLKTLIKPVHDLCYGHESYVVIISETATQAAGKLKDIRAELLENSLLIEYFGPFFSTRNVAETVYVAKSRGHRCMYQAFGAGAELRGIRFGRYRPTKIILDDAEDSDEVHNEELRSKREDWFKQVVSKLGDKETNLEVVGTLLHKDSLLANLTRNPAYRARQYKAVISWSEREDLWEKWRQIYGNLDDDNRLVRSRCFYEENQVEMLRGTQVLWPERASYYDLMIEMFEIGRKAFFKEMQNEPRASDQQLFENLHWFVETPDGFLIEKTGVLIPWKDLEEPLAAMDPSAGQSKPKPGKLGDFTSIPIGRKDKRGRLFVQHDWTKRVAPTKYIAAIFDLWELFQFDRFAVETNLYRNLLLPNIEQARRDREAKRKAEGRNPWGIRIKFYDVENVENKLKRIYTLEPKVENGYILFNKTLSQEFVNQLEAFPLGEHDDGPDALEMLWSLANGRYQASSLGLHAQKGR
jgi:predicted phage terminase large subunit-like protein